MELSNLGAGTDRTFIYSILNVITTGDLRQAVDVSELNNYSWGRYDTENNYNGKVGYVKDVNFQGRVTVFSSGKLISTGTKTISGSKKQLEHTLELLISYFEIRKVKLKPIVQNIVAMIDVKAIINLNYLSGKLSHFIYEPDQFAGLIYKTGLGATCLIFASGKIIIAGAKSEARLRLVASNLYQLLKVP